MEALLLAVRGGGPTMLARIGIMKAFNRHVVREFKPSEKKTHWGKAEAGAGSMMAIKIIWITASRLVQ
jgi:hypothetical protein